MAKIKLLPVYKGEIHNIIIDMKKNPKPICNGNLLV